MILGIHIDYCFPGLKSTELLGDSASQVIEKGVPSRWEVGCPGIIWKN